MIITGTQLGIILSVITIAIAIGGLALRMLIKVRESERRLTKMETDIKEVKDVLWKMLDPVIANVLHKPHNTHIRTDTLLEKWEATKHLNLRENKELRSYAEQVMKENEGKESLKERAEYHAAALMILRLKMEAK